MSIVSRRRAALPPARWDRAAAPKGPGLPGRALRRVLEGPHEWGDLEIWTSRYGYTGCCLVVHPPGTTRRERIRYRLLRGWPPIGMLLGVLVLIVSAHHLPLGVAVLAGGAAYGAGALGLARLAGPARKRIRTLQTCRGDDGTDALDRGPQQLLDRLAARLLDAERRRRAGGLDAVGFEAVWGDVWHELGAGRSTAR
ncbi:DUF6611 family protein [uncultured Amnibacterium sp.]|uniref:DUF6611 family protein n=1 Tax=uncultured Amnibacterium sp. TaxID=1631851 RepID=UPI0035CAE3C5